MQWYDTPAFISILLEINWQFLSKYKLTFLAEKWKTEASNSYMTLESIHSERPLKFWCMCPKVSYKHPARQVTLVSEGGVRQQMQVPAP